MLEKVINLEETQFRLQHVDAVSPREFWAVAPIALSVGESLAKDGFKFDVVRVSNANSEEVNLEFIGSGSQGVYRCVVRPMFGAVDAVTDAVARIDAQSHDPMMKAVAVRNILRRFAHSHSSTPIHPQLIKVVGSGSLSNSAADKSQACGDSNIAIQEAKQLEAFASSPPIEVMSDEAAIETKVVAITSQPIAGEVHESSQTQVASKSAQQAQEQSPASFGAAPPVRSDQSATVSDLDGLKKKKFDPRSPVFILGDLRELYGRAWVWRCPYVGSPSK